MTVKTRVEHRGWAPRLPTTAGAILRLLVAAALLVLASALAAVLVYRYLKVSAFGPIPSMYEPVWYFKKSLSAVAEAAGLVLSAAALIRSRRAGPC